MSNTLIIKKEDFFSNKIVPISASSPGRLDVMGGIADYSGALVMEMTIRENTTVFISKRIDNIVRVYSSLVNEELICELSDLRQQNYSHLRTKYGKSWGLYVLGCIHILTKEKNILLTGLSIWIDSEVPLGKGVSSSAAIEVATLKALDKLYKLNLGDTELPILAQKVENVIVGAPCGLMDQLTSYLGEENKLLPILCQPVTLLPSVALPPDVKFIGIDSGVKHSVSASSYVDVRTAAFMGYSYIAKIKGVSNKDILLAKETGNKNQLPYKGYLANIVPSEFYRFFYSLLPEKMNGSDFMEIHEETLDHVTTVNKDTFYKVKMATMHPVMENSRVQLFKTLLTYLSSLKEEVMANAVLVQIGELMYQSHSSYSFCGLGNEYTDMLVDLSLVAGPNSGVYGAKITGGGSGGTVVFLAKGNKGEESVYKIMETYKDKSGKTPYLFNGSSNGGKFNV